MMRRYHKPSLELRSMFNAEWKFAKSIFPSLRKEHKPMFYVATNLGSWHGIHSGRVATIGHKVNGRWVKGRHLIAIQKKHSQSESGKVLSTIRHEIIHCIHQNHGRDFKLCLSHLNEKARRKNELDS